MKYSTYLRELFGDTNLNIEDLLLLENFQIKYLPERVPQKEFAALLRTYPIIHRFLIKKEPSVESFLDKILMENKPIQDQDTIDDYCDEVIWEIGELIVYNKFPEVYDSKINFTWEIEDILSTDLLKDKTIADVGAGSGMLSLLLSPYVKTVYAFEPLGSFRNFIKNKVSVKRINNIYTMEGFLESVPIPDNSIDYLFTSNAIGWNFEKEQKEIERVVKPGGQAIHLMRAFDKDAASPYHDQLLKWNYEFQQFKTGGYKAKYYKTFQKKFSPFKGA